MKRNILVITSVIVAGLHISLAAALDKEAATQNEDKQTRFAERVVAIQLVRTLSADVRTTRQSSHATQFTDVGCGIGSDVQIETSQSNQEVTRIQVGSGMGWEESAARILLGFRTQHAGPWYTGFLAKAIRSNP